MNGLDLFSGIGGISKALEPWVRTIAYCEKDRFCQSILLSRMSKGDIDVAPIWDDVTTLDADLLPRIDIVFGGFPCQDISVAGHGRGLDGDRSGLFFSLVRIVCQARPRFVFLENVPAITHRGLDRVCREMAQVGYDCRWGMLSAKEVGAKHKRDRWFMLGYAKYNGSFASEDGTSIRKESVPREGEKQTEKIGESEGTGLLCDSYRLPSDEANKRTIAFKEEWEARRGSAGQCWEDISSKDWMEIEPEVGLLVDGLSPEDVARIRALGNSVVPRQVREAFKMLMGIK